MKKRKFIEFGIGWLFILDLIAGNIDHAETFVIMLLIMIYLEVKHD